MNNYGFFLKRLQIVGDKVETTGVNFSSGLNVIHGPSDTGKTYIYQCINYMLGSSHIPKDIPQAKNYKSCFLEIESYKGITYTLERSLQGGDFKLYKNELDNLGLYGELKSDNQSNEKSISDFLLKTCNIEKKKIRKNVKGAKQNLYFQDLQKYFMVDEVKIITEHSPIAEINTRDHINIKRTFQENVFKFLMSGQDDSSIITLLTKDDITNKTGKRELLEEIIKSLTDDLAEGPNLEEIDSQIEKIDGGIESFKENYSLTKEKFSVYETKKNYLYNDLVQKETRVNMLNEILKRSNILAKQYDSDINRLKATCETSKSLDVIEILNCPICKSEIKSKKIIDLESIVRASKKEIIKIVLLLKELNESVLLFQEEQAYLKNEIAQAKREHRKIVDIIENEIGYSLSEIEKKINGFLDKKSKLIKARTIYEELEKYQHQKEVIEKIISGNKKNGKNTEYEKLTTALLTPFTDVIYTIFKSMKYENLGSNVGFSEDYLDFVIAGKDRKNFGKGYRAILYAVFIVSMQKYLDEKQYKIGFTLIDSPLNPYKPEESKVGEIPNNLANSFYTYLYQNIKQQQVIIIENTKVPEEFENDIRYIQYSLENGFIPKT